MHLVAYQNPAHRSSCWPCRCERAPWRFGESWEQLPNIVLSSVGLVWELVPTCFFTVIREQSVVWDFSVFFLLFYCLLEVTDTAASHLLRHWPTKRRVEEAKVGRSVEMVKSKHDKRKREGFSQNEQARNSALVWGLDSVVFRNYVREAEDIVPLRLCWVWEEIFIT